MIEKGLGAMPISYLHVGGPDYLELIHNGEIPEFEAFAKSFLAAAGDDLVRVAEKLLDETSSSHAHALISVLLGRAKDPATFPLLRSLVTKGASHQVLTSVLYSIGLVRAPESTPFLVEYWKKNVKNTDRYARMRTAAALGRCGKAGANFLLELALPHTAEAREKGHAIPYFDYLANVRSAEAFPVLKKAAESEADLGIQIMAMTAIARSPDIAQRKYLMKAYIENENHLIRHTIVQELLSSRMRESSRWEEIKTELSGTLDSILDATKYPTGNSSLDQNVIFLAGMVGTESGKARLHEFMKLPLPVEARDRRSHVRAVVGALAEAGADLEEQKRYLELHAETSKDRMDLLSMLVRTTKDKRVHRPFLDEILVYIRGGPNTDYVLGNSIVLVSTSSALSPKEVSGAIGEAYENAPDEANRMWILEQLERRASMYSRRESVAPFLESIIENESDILPRIRAANAYLRGLRSGRSMNEETRRAVFGLVRPESVHRWGPEIVSAGRNNPFALIDTIGGYYARYGTKKDATWLGSLPDTFAEETGMEGELGKTFRRRLSEECQRAMDAIRLRN